jgi:hypothetical protein
VPEPLPQTCSFTTGQISTQLTSTGATCSTGEESFYCSKKKNLIENFFLVLFHEHFGTHVPNLSKELTFLKIPLIM